LGVNVEDSQGSSLLTVYYCAGTSAEFVLMVGEDIPRYDDGGIWDMCCKA